MRLDRFLKREQTVVRLEAAEAAHIEAGTGEG
jgi:hypothetical protein